MKKEINSFQCSELANCIAFHDFSIKHIRINDFINYIIDLFHEYGLEPTRMGISSPLNQTKSMNTFSREKKKLQTIPEDEIIAISLDATAFQSHDRIFSLYFDKENLGQCVLALDNQFFSFDTKKMKKIYQEIISFLSPNYAYSYKREFKKGPIWYPCGAISGLPFGDPERRLIDTWGKKYDNGTYKTGDLRDIFPMNLLVNAHLIREVLPNTSFEKFIDSDKRYGILENITDGHYTWVVDDVNIPLVREALRPSGMIIAG